MEAGQPDLETRTSTRTCCYARHVAVIKTELVSSAQILVLLISYVPQAINFVEYTRWRAAGTSGYSPI